MALDSAEVPEGSSKECMAKRGKPIHHTARSQGRGRGGEQDPLISFRVTKFPPPPPPVPRDLELPALTISQHLGEQIYHGSLRAKESHESQVQRKVPSEERKPPQMRKVWRNTLGCLQP